MLKPVAHQDLTHLGRMKTMSHLGDENMENENKN